MNSISLVFVINFFSMAIKKFNSKTILIFTVAFALFLLAFFIFRFDNKNMDVSGSAVINGKKIGLEVVKTSQDISRGLGLRDNLESDKGMLFVFSKSDHYVFWMKDMRFSIDIIWLQDDIVVDITKNVPVEPGVSLQKLKLYSPQQKVNRVLEVNAGFSDKNNVKAGDKIIYNYE